MSFIGNFARIRMRKLGVAFARGKDPLKLARRMRHLGDAYSTAGRADHAERCYGEALSIYRARPDTKPLDLANALRGLAVVKHGTGAADEAQRLWHEAHGLYVSVNVQSGIAESAARLALLASRRSDLPRSREYLREARAAADASHDDKTMQYVRQVTALMESRP
jgi:tetratricopeptide (TPR) repeat protein